MYTEKYLQDMLCMKLWQRAWTGPYPAHLPTFNWAVRLRRRMDGALSRLPRLRLWPNNLINRQGRPKAKAWHAFIIQYWQRRGTQVERRIANHPEFSMRPESCLLLVGILEQDLPQLGSFQLWLCPECPCWSFSSNFKCSDWGSVKLYVQFKRWMWKSHLLCSAKSSNLCAQCGPQLSDVRGIIKAAG